MEIEKKIQITEKRVVAIKCDCCKKIHEGNYLPSSWKSFYSMHFGWGNDSIDSRERFDVCSPECYATIFKKKVKEHSEYCDFEIDSFSSDFAIALSELMQKGLK